MGIPIRQVDAANDDAIDRRFDIPALRIDWIAGQGVRIAIGSARRDRGTLQFLEADDIGLGRPQPSEQIG